MDTNKQKPGPLDMEPERSRFSTVTLLIVILFGAVIYVIRNNFYDIPDTRPFHTVESGLNPNFAIAMKTPLKRTGKTNGTKTFSTRKEKATQEHQLNSFQKKKSGAVRKIPRPIAKSELTSVRTTKNTEKSSLTNTPVYSISKILKETATSVPVLIESAKKAAPANKNQISPKKTSAKNKSKMRRKNKKMSKGIWNGIYSPFITQKFMVIRREPAWRNVWKQLNISNPDKNILPEINFKKYVILGLFLGQQNTGGHSIELVKLDYKKTKVIAYYQVKRPSEGSLVTQSLTQPYFLKQTKSSKLPFTFIEIKQ